MIYLTNGVDDCKFSTYNPAFMRLGSMAESEEIPCIRINGYYIQNIDLDGFDKMSYDEKVYLLQRVFEKFCRYNYPPFWRSPFRYLFDGRKCYDWGKFRFS